jgi:signal transduction histidine kinase
MTMASDQNGNSCPLSPLAQRMAELREVVFAEWEKSVRASITEAAMLSHPVLIDTLPALYDNLLEALTPEYPRTSAATATPSVATEHGGERARLTGYEAKAVIMEYQLFRAAILDVLQLNNVPISNREMQIISSSIDACIREAVTAFALAQAAFREQFIAALAHDLRSPLAAASMAGHLISRTKDIETINRYAVKITANLHRVDEMIREMLDTVIFQRGERLRLNICCFDLGDLVRDVLSESEIVHGPRFTVSGTSVVGWWSRDAMKRALENLISNSVKYGLPDTPISIAFKEYHGRVLLSVHNEGEPIPPDQVESIFQVFERAKAAKEGNKEGWGIGLPFVRRVAESHGGSIDLDSAPERGTTFAMDFPVDARPFQNAPTLE